MNPYIKYRKEIDAFWKKHEAIKKKFKVKEMKALEELNKEYPNAMAECDHTDKDGMNAAKRSGQDPGSGKTEYTCEICFRDV